MKNTIYSSIMLMALFGLLLLMQTLFPVTPGVVDPVPRTIRYGFTLHNTTGNTLTDALLWVRTPVHQPGMQEVVRLSVSHPFRVSSSGIGNRVISFPFDPLQPYTTQVITVQAELALSASPKPTVLPNPDIYLKAGRFIESEHSIIKEASRRLKSWDQLKTVERIYQLVAYQVVFQGSPCKNKGALQTLMDRESGAADFMHLFVALVRAAGIPARGVCGYLCLTDRYLGPEDYLHWGEFYHEGAWHIADPRLRRFMPDPSEYVTMRIIDPLNDIPTFDFSCFRIEGPGIVVRMNGN